MSFQQRKVVRALEKYGCRLIRQGGNHIIMQASHGDRVKVPRHREIKRGTARSIAKEAGIDWDTFRKEIG